MEPNKVDFSTGSINVGGPGDALLSFADRQSKLYNAGLDRVLHQAQINEEKRKWDIANKRAEDVAARERNEYDRVLNERQVLSEYASKPLDTATMIDSQRSLMDEALIEKAKQLNRPFTEEESAQIVKAYDSIVPFREDVENKIYKDLVGKNVDPVKAKQYAQLESEKYQSIPEYQKYLTDLSEKKTASEKERFKDTLELSKFQNDAYKTELDKYKTRMDLFTKMIGGSGGAGSTAGGIGGFSQDKSKAYEKAYTKAGNEDELVKRIDAAFTKYGAKAVNNALAASGIDEPVRFFELDVGKRDVALDRFDKALENERPISELKGQFGADVPIAPTYNLPSVAQVYTPESARATAQMSARDRLMSVLNGFDTQTNSSVNGPAISSTDSYANKVAKVESSGTKNPYEAVNNQSGAMGKYQFVNSTLNDYRKEFGNFTNEQFMKNPELQENVFKAYTNDIDKFIEKRGYEANDRNRWIAHNLGMGNLDKVLSGDFNDPGLKKAISVNLPKGVEPTVQNYLDYWKGFSASVPKEFEERTAKANREALFTVDNNGKKVLDEKAMALRKLMFDVNDKPQTIDDVRKLAPEASNLSIEELLSREPIQLAKQNVSEDGVMSFINRNRNQTLPEIVKTEFNIGREESLKEQQKRQASIAIKVKAGLPLTPSERAWIERMKDTKQNRERLFELGIE